MRKVLYFLMSVSLVYCSFPKLHADTIPDSTEVYGFWSLENSPYVILGVATVPPDSTLTIEAGVIIKLKSSMHDSAFILEYLDVGLIRVLGKIVAVGSENDSITFTRNGDGRWGIIKLYDSSEGNIFKYCSFSYANTVYSYVIPGGEDYDGTIAVYNSDVLVENSSIRNNLTGLQAQYSHLTAINNDIRYNEGGISCYESTSFLVGNYIYENGQNGINSYISTSIIKENLVESNIVGILSYESNDTISHNTAINNLWGGIHITRNNSLVEYNLIYGSNSGIRCSGQPSLINNTIVNNHYIGIYCDWEAEPIVVNSIIYGNPSLVHHSTNNIVVFANCLLQTDTLEPGLINAGGNIFNSDPLFSDTTNFDFTLTGDSPCIDMGTVFFMWNGETILNLTPDQYYGNAPDMGAFESNFVKIDKNYTQDEITLFPNPASSFITLTAPGDLPIKEVIIYNHLGQKVLTAKPVNNMVDVSGLKAGMYMIEVRAKEFTGRQKLIKQ